MAHDLTNGKITDHNNLLLCVDGGSQPKNPGVAACGWVIFDDKKNVLVEEARIVSLHNTNNYAEYCGLGHSLRWLVDQNWRGQLTVQADSQLLIYQVAGQWKCNAENLRPMRHRIWDHLEALELYVVKDELRGMKATRKNLFGEQESSSLCELKWVPRELNSYADALSDSAFAQHWNPAFPVPLNFVGLK